MDEKKLKALEKVKEEISKIDKKESNDSFKEDFIRIYELIHPHYGYQNLFNISK